MPLRISDPIPVHIPTMTPAISHWGVYAIPRLWREPTGELVVRFNGEEDSSDIDNMQRAPNLYFISTDDGLHWKPCPDGDSRYDISVLTGIDPPFRRLRDGSTVYLKSRQGLPPIKGVTPLKEFVTPCGDAVVHAYRWGDIPAACKGIDFCRIDADGHTTTVDAVMDFPERELLINAKALSGGEYVPVDEYVQPFVFKLPYFSAIRELPDGTLAALCCGQHPDVADHFYSEVYLITSDDGGKVWKKRAVVAGGITPLPYGFGGDGAEVSLAVDSSGDLYCVMRMDLSSDPRRDPHPWDTMLCISRDGGYTWSAPRAIADSSVTPHIIALAGDVLALIYGRPGVHVRISCDRGETWSKPYSLIGKTLSEERLAGRNDFDSKYGAPASYCNTFWEPLDEHSFLVLCNSLTHPDENGVPTKAAFVRKISFIPT